jgi:hemerythrin
MDENWKKDVDVRLDIHQEQIIALQKAFPAEDAEGHRRYHEAIIEKTAEIRRLRQAIQEKTISGLIWAAIVWFGIAVFHEFQSVIQNGQDLFIRK